MTWSSNDSQVTEKQLFDEAAPALTDIIDELKVRFMRANKNGRSYVTMMDQANYRTYPHRKYGKCYTFQPEEDTLKLGIYYIKATL